MAPAFIICCKLTQSSVIVAERNLYCRIGDPVTYWCWRTKGKVTLFCPLAWTEARAEELSSFCHNLNGAIAWRRSPRLLKRSRSCCSVEQTKVNASKLPQQVVWECVCRAAPATVHVPGRCSRTGAWNRKSFIPIALRSRRQILWNCEAFKWRIGRMRCILPPLSFYHAALYAARWLKRVCAPFVENKSETPKAWRFSLTLYMLVLKLSPLSSETCPPRWEKK